MTYIKHLGGYPGKVGLANEARQTVVARLLACMYTYVYEIKSLEYASIYIYLCICVSRDVSHGWSEG